MLTFSKLPGLTGARNLNGCMNCIKCSLYSECKGTSETLTRFCPVKCQKITVKDNVNHTFDSIAKSVLDMARRIGFERTEVVFIKEKEKLVLIYIDQDLDKEHRQIMEQAMKINNLSDLSSRILNGYYIICATGDWVGGNRFMKALEVPSFHFSKYKSQHYIVFVETGSAPFTYYTIQDNRDELDPQIALAEGWLYNPLIYNPFVNAYTCQNGSILAFEPVAEDENCAIPVLKFAGKEPMRLPRIQRAQGNQNAWRNYDSLGLDEPWEWAIDAFISKYKIHERLAVDIKPLLKETEYAATVDGEFTISKVKRQQSL